MRTLNFIVEGQIIKPSPSCDFANLVPGTEGYLQAKFAFSSEWNGCTKVVEFRSKGIEREPQLLTNGETCAIPAKALKSKTFTIRVIGKNNDLKLTTNRLTVTQNGG